MVQKKCYIGNFVNTALFIYMIYTFKTSYRNPIYFNLLVKPSND